MGPWTGVIIEFIKNLSHLPFSHTSYVGEMANFIVCGSFVFAAGFVYQRNKTKQNALIGLTVGTIVMTIFGILVNYYINLPFYASAMGIDLDAIIGMSQAVGNTLVTDMKSLLVFVFAPFNIFKGIVISTIVMLIYKNLVRFYINNNKICLKKTPDIIPTLNKMWTAFFRAVHIFAF